MVGDNQDLQDRDLHDRFRAARREEEAGVPLFTIPSPAVRRHGFGRLSGEFIAVAVCLVTMVGTAVWLMPGHRMSQNGLNREPYRAAASIASWKSETDFLLDTPGREMLQGVPEIGAWHGPAIAPRGSERRRHSRNQVLSKGRNSS